MKNYNIEELVDKYAKDYGYTKIESRQIIDNIKEMFVNILVDGDTVNLQEFGKFEVVKRAARFGRNPKIPGSKIQIPEKRSIKFKLSKILEEKVN